MTSTTDTLDTLIEDIQTFLTETAHRDLFSSGDVADHLLDYRNKVISIKELLEG
jgi:hypothetical protein